MENSINYFTEQNKTIEGLSSSRILACKIFKMDELEDPQVGETTCNELFIKDEIVDENGADTFQQESREYALGELFRLQAEENGVKEETISDDDDINDNTFYDPEDLQMFIICEGETREEHRKRMARERLKRWRCRQPQSVLDRIRKSDRENHARRRRFLQKIPRPRTSVLVEGETKIERKRRLGRERQRRWKQKQKQAQLDRYRDKHKADLNEVIKCDGEPS